MSASVFRQSCRPVPADETRGLDGAALSAWLRRRHRFGVSGEVAHRTGIAAGTVENWLGQKARPNLGHFLRLVAVYGPELVAATWADAPAYVIAAARVERAAALEAEIAALEAERAHRGGRMTRHWRWRFWDALARAGLGLARVATARARRSRPPEGPLAEFRAAVAEAGWNVERAERVLASMGRADHRQTIDLADVVALRAAGAVTDADRIELTPFGRRVLAELRGRADGRV
jgi:hypothetical protein